MQDEIPRRNRIDLDTPAERVIRYAIDAVEHMGADVRLTDAVNLLQKAKDKVADFVDSETTSKPCDSTSTEAPGQMNK